METSKEVFTMETLTRDGAWCWFSEPRAIYHHGEKEQTYAGWITSGGDVTVAALNHETGSWTSHVVHRRLEADDHDHPVIYVRKDNRLVVFYSKHSKGSMYVAISKRPEDITEWREADTFGENVTYANPLRSGDSLFVFYRDLNWHPTLITSGDEGETWEKPRQFIRGGGERPYAKYTADKFGRIFTAFTGGHPRKEPRNKIFFANYDFGLVKRGNGTMSSIFAGENEGIDIDRDPLDTVYNAFNGKAWIWDIACADENEPVLVYAMFPTDTAHQYYYARWNGEKWENHRISEGGGWFPQTPGGEEETEPNYSGGVTLDHEDPFTVYLSKPVNGVFEIFRYITPDSGRTWQSEQLTHDTPAGVLNVRPVVPRNHKPGAVDLLWMRGSYTHYTDFGTQIMAGSFEKK